ncbi:unnamed protein product [Malus baccata var. baccata]
MGTNVDATSGNDNSHASKYEYLFGKAQRELYPGCENFSVLSFIVELMHIKCLSLMSNKHFDMLLNLLKRSHPASIPSTNNDAKKMLRELGLGYESIHACKNDSALFWKTNEKLDKCLECGEPRHTAKDMNWHKERRVNEEGVLRHLPDSDEWKEFDKQYPLFAQDSRNVRLGLATDGFNPFANMSKPYSMWPVILVCYNLPPWKCMKAMFSMLTLLIHGPNAPRKEIDVYLHPLVDELKELWVDVIQTFDASTKEFFRMHACVLWTINDFPAYGNLSSWSTKGYLACPICNKDITSQRITNKISYIGHRRFLPCGHAWKEMSIEYNGHTEHRLPPKVLFGAEILQQLDKVRSFSPGKYENNRERDRPRAAEELNWTKKSIFFDVIRTLLNIEGKTKDTDNARRDLEAMKIRSNQHLRLESGKMRKPHARYRLLPVGIHPFLDTEVCNALIELSLFFLQNICARTLRVSDLERMEKEIVITLCKLEMIFPPAFFDIMVHLVIHLPREANLGGPVNNRWMYPIERLLGKLKKYVKKKARPKGSLIEGYIVNGSMTFCSLYLRGVETRFNPNERNDDGRNDRNVGGLSVFSQKARPFGVRKFILLPKKEIDKAHWFVLHNCDEVQPYLIEHMDELKLKSNEILCQRQEQEFPKWFEIRIYGLREMGSLEVTDDLHYLSCKPDIRVHTYTGCIVNGVRFQKKGRDNNRTTQNSGIFVSGEHSDCSHDYYSVLESDDPYILAKQAQQVFYIDDYKVQCRHIWDVPKNDATEEVDEDIETTTDNNVYQKDEFNEVRWVVQEDQENLLSSDDEMDEDSEDESPVYAVESDPTYRVNSRHDDEDSEEDNPLDDGEDEEILESDDSDGIDY